MTSTITTYGDDINIDIFNKSQQSIMKFNGSDSELNDLYNEYFSNMDKQSFNELRLGDIVSGTVTCITEKELVLNVYSKDDVYVNLTKENESALHYSIGDEVNVIIIEDMVTSSYIKGSIKEYKRFNLRNELLDYTSRKVYDAKVLSLHRNGYVLNIDGLDVFMPGSLGGVNKLTNFDVLLGKTIKVIPIENNNTYSKFKSTVIVSHREYLNTLIPSKLKELKIGESYKGIVTGCSKHGVFVQFNDILTGLISKDDLDEETRKLYDSRLIKGDDSIEFKVKTVIYQFKKVVLSQKHVEKVRTEFEIDEEVKCEVFKVIRDGLLVKFGGCLGKIFKNRLKKDLSSYKFRDKFKGRIYEKRDTKYTLMQID